MPLIIALIILFVVVEPIVLIWAMVRFGWSKLAEAFPAQAIEPDAVRRNFQSFRIGIMNLGYSIHVAADQGYLHLEPARYLRWLGAGPVSIPWDDIEIVKRSRLARWITIKAGSHKITGPEWCLSLAEPVE